VLRPVCDGIYQGPGESLPDRSVKRFPLAAAQIQRAFAPPWNSFLGADRSPNSTPPALGAPGCAGPFRNRAELEKGSRACPRKSSAAAHPAQQLAIIFSAIIYCVGGYYKLNVVRDGDDADGVGGLRGEPADIFGSRSPSGLLDDIYRRGGLARPEDASVAFPRREAGSPTALLRAAALLGKQSETLPGR